MCSGVVCMYTIIHDINIGGDEQCNTSLRSSSRIYLKANQVYLTGLALLVRLASKLVAISITYLLSFQEQTTTTNGRGQSGVASLVGMYRILPNNNTSL